VFALSVPWSAVIGRLQLDRAGQLRLPVTAEGAMTSIAAFGEEALKLAPAAALAVLAPARVRRFAVVDWLLVGLASGSRSRRTRTRCAVSSRASAPAPASPTRSRRPCRADPRAGKRLPAVRLVADRRREPVDGGQRRHRARRLRVRRHQITTALVAVAVGLGIAAWRRGRRSGTGLAAAVAWPLGGVALPVAVFWVMVCDHFATNASLQTQLDWLHEPTDAPHAIGATWELFGHGTGRGWTLLLLAGLAMLVDGRAPAPGRPGHGPRPAGPGEWPDSGWWPGACGRRPGAGGGLGALAGLGPAAARRPRAAGRRRGRRVACRARGAGRRRHGHRARPADHVARRRARAAPRGRGPRAGVRAHAAGAADRGHGGGRRPRPRRLAGGRRRGGCAASHCSRAPRSRSWACSSPASWPAAIGLGLTSPGPAPYHYLASYLDALADWWDGLSFGQQLLAGGLLAAGLALAGLGTGLSFGLAGVGTWVAEHGHGVADFTTDPAAATRDYLANAGPGQLVLDGVDAVLTFAPGNFAGAATGHAIVGAVDQYAADPGAARAAWHAFAADERGAITLGEGLYDGPQRLARGNLGERLASDALAADGYDILAYKPDIIGTNQGGIDIVAMRGDDLYLVDNKALTRSGNVSSVSALTDNFARTSTPCGRTWRRRWRPAAAARRRPTCCSAPSTPSTRAAWSGR
jgi:hypothetical protein